MKYIWHAAALIIIIWLVVSHWSRSRQNRQQAGFPVGPIQVVVPYAAGGGTDIFARMIQRAVAEDEVNPQTFAILNQPGGSGTIGSRNVKVAKPDGYKILCLHEGIITSKLSGTVPYGPEAFEPIAQTGDIILVVVVSSDSRFETLEDLLNEIAENPDQVRFGTNLGSPAHFAARSIENTRPGARFNYVQSGGGQKRYTLLIGDHIDVGIFSLAEFKTYVGGGDIRALAVMTDERHAAIPDTPTTVEQGCAATASNGLYWWAPKGTSRQRVDALASILERAMQSESAQTQLKQLSIDSVFTKSDELRGKIKARTDALGALAEETDHNLPDFPLYAIVAVGLLAVAAVAESLVKRRGTTRISAESNAPNADLNESEAMHPASKSPMPHKPLQARPSSNDAATKQPKRLNDQEQYMIAGGALIALIVYVLLMQFNIVSFAIATPAAIFAIGAMMIGWQPRRLVTLAEIAIITGLGTAYIFTEVFSVSLP